MMLGITNSEADVITFSACEQNGPEKTSASDLHDHAPSPTTTDGEAANPGPGAHRLRRRGPRTQQAQARRVFNNHSRKQESHIALEKFVVWHVNMQGLMSRRKGIDELAARIRIAERPPDIVGITESWLDKSIEAAQLEGYIVTARRDRDADSGRGGVLIFAKENIAERVVTMEESAQAERIWAVVHTNHGPYVIAMWYRPPCPGELKSITSFEEEVVRLRGEALGTLICGDMNVHQRKWLRHSSSNSKEGELLQQKCQELGLEQIVHEPTRGNYLLDLALTDIPEAKATVLPAIADHRVVQIQLDLTVPKTQAIRRQVWKYAEADWQRLREELEELDWNFLQNQEPDAGAEYLTQTILELSDACIGRKWVTMQKSTHPWLNDRVVEKVKEKTRAEGTPNEQAAAQTCSAAILEEQRAWSDRMKLEMHSMRTGSKAWWGRSKQLLDLHQKVSSIPALKNPSGQWVTDPHGKAELFATTFQAKYNLAQEEANEFSTVVTQPDEGRIEIQPLQLQQAQEVLAKLDEASATGPDSLPTRILKNMAGVLAYPFFLLAQSILAAGRWPEPWVIHWVVPLYKKNRSTSQATTEESTSVRSCPKRWSD